MIILFQLSVSIITFGVVIILEGDGRYLKVSLILESRIWLYWLTVIIGAFLRQKVFAIFWEGQETFALMNDKPNELQSLRIVELENSKSKKLCDQASGRRYLAESLTSGW